MSIRCSLLRGMRRWTRWWPACMSSSPGHRFQLTGDIDAHHDRARWDWALVGPDGGVPVAAGVDVATFAPDGRLRAVTGFFHQPATA